MIDMRRMTLRAPLLMAWLCTTVGCGTDGAGLGYTDPGKGSGTLLVQASATYDSTDNITELSVRIRKAGADVDGAKVSITSDGGSADLPGRGGGEYAASQTTWSPQGYVLHISVLDMTGRETDTLEASLVAPVRVQMNAEATKPFDPHTLPNQVLTLTWEGPAAERATVRSEAFKPPTFVPDPLMVGIPAQFFQHDTQQVSITRENSVALAGGVPGSTFTARYRFDARLTVINPY
jgi:hypothetical protein